MRPILFLLLCCWGHLGFCNQWQPTSQLQADTTLPKVFMIGEHEQQYEALAMEHGTMLLTACEDDMDVAYGKWWSMIQEIEAYSVLIGYDLKGIKAWVNFFWEKDGRIRHITYYLKPNSKLVDQDELKAFFSSFMNHYTFPLVAEERYSHYSTASFPTSPRRVSAQPERKPQNQTPSPKDSSRNEDEK
ncbi:MAG: hypothetical protein AAFV95_21525 [Bacteroidota bacterium]